MKLAPSVLRTMLARTQADSDARGCHNVPLGHSEGSNAMVLVLVLGLGLAMACSVSGTNANAGTCAMS